MVNEKLNQMHKVLQMMFEFFEDKHYDVDEDGRHQELSDFYHAMRELNEMMEPVTITSEMVRELREQTGHGMMECQRVLMDCRGDINRAKEYLR